jgi:ATP10 protein
MKKLLLAITLLCCINSYAQQLFPTLSCETLADKKLVIPNDVKGKRTVVCLAMSPKAEKMLRAWNNPLYTALFAEGMGGLMGGRMYDANLCFVGMLKGIAKLGLTEAKKQSKKEVEKKLHSNFMVSDDDVNALMKNLNITDVKEPHFFVLDGEGKVIYHTQGEYSEQKMNDITEKLL